MALSFVQHTASGSTDTFAIPFPYLEESDISVEVDGTPEAFTFSDAANVKITSGSPAADAIVEVRRTTKNTGRDVDFQKGSNLTERVLDLDSDQMFFVMQEVFDSLTDKLGLDPTAIWDALSKRIKSVADPTAAQDAVTKAYLEANTTNLTGGVMDALSKRIINVTTSSVAGDAVNNTRLMTALTTELALVALAPVSTFVQTLIDDTSASAFMDTLGISTFVQTILNDAAASNFMDTLGISTFMQTVLDDTTLAAAQATLGVTKEGIDQVARDNVALLAFKMAVTESFSIFNMVAGFMDEFEDETGLDNTASINESYSVANDRYTNTGNHEQAVTQSFDSESIIGDMTEGSGLAHAFDGNENQSFDGGASVSNGNAGYAGKHWGVDNTKMIDKFQVHASTDEGFVKGATPTDCKLILEGSQNNSDWTTLYTSSTFSDSANKIRTHSHADHVFVMTTAYRYHRVRITCGGSGTAVGYQELKFWEQGAFDDLTLISESQPANTEPTDVHLVIFEQDGPASTLTPDTDIKGWASRDGGTTWTQVPLVDKGDYETGKRVLIGTASIAGQPSGTNMEYKITTHNAKQATIEGVFLSWS